MGTGYIDSEAQIRELNDTSRRKSNYFNISKIRKDNNNVQDTFIRLRLCL